MAELRFSNSAIGIVVKQRNWTVLRGNRHNRTKGAVRSPLALVAKQTKRRTQRNNVQSVWRCENFRIGLFNTSQLKKLKDLALIAAVNASVRLVGSLH